ncbi:MAG: YncE family protein [Thermoplasmata archaeon]|nr:YncE family protein [Thermoplasmata archaeon]
MNRPISVAATVLLVVLLLGRPGTTARPAVSPSSAREPPASTAVSLGAPHSAPTGTEFGSPRSEDSPLRATVAGGPSPQALTVSYRQETLDLLNGTSLPGNQLVPGGHGPSFPALYDPGTGRWYIYTLYSGTLAVINETNDTDLANIPVNVSGIGEIAIDPIDHAVYLTNETGSSVLIVNATTLSVQSTLSVGSGPVGIAWDPAAGDMVVANPGSNTTSWIRGTTQTVVSTVNVSGGPSSVLYDSSTGEIVVGDGTAHNVTVLNSSSRNVTATVGVGSRPQVVFQNPANGVIFVSNGGSGNTTLLNGTTFASLGNLSVSPLPGWVGYDPSLNRIFLGNGLYSSEVVGLDASNDTPVFSSPVTFWSRGLDVDLATGQVYVSGGVNNSVTVLNGSTGAAVVTVGSFYTPTVVQYDPLRGEVDISEEGGANISALNGTTHTVDVDIATGTVSEWTGADPSGPSVSVGSGCGGNDVLTVNSSSRMAGTCSFSTGNVVASASDRVDGRMFLVTGGSQVYTLNETTGAIALFLNETGGSFTPAIEGVAWSPVNDTLYVANSNWGNVSVYNASTGRFLTSVGLGTSSEPATAMYDPFDGTVWVVGEGGSSIRRIYASNYTVAASIPVGAYPYGVALDPQTQQAYVTVDGPADIAVVGAANDTVVTQFTVGGYPGNVVVDTQAQLVFATTGYANLTVLDAIGLTKLASLPMVPEASGLSYDGSSGVVTVSSATFPEVEFVAPAVMGGLEVERFHATPENITLGQSMEFVAETARGNGTLRFAYTGLPTGCASANASVLNCTPTRPGNYTVQLNVTDQSGVSALAETSVSVSDTMAIESETAVPAVIDLGMSTRLTASVDGGALPITYTWGGLPNGCLSANASSITCTPNGTTGTFNATLAVEDAAGVRQTSEVAFVVNPAPSLTTLSATPSLVDVGQPVRITAAGTGGTGPLTTTFSQLPPGCGAPGGSADSVTCTPDESGTYTVNGTLNDSLGVSLVWSLRIVVDPDPAVASIQFAPSPSIVGIASEIVPAITGGALPYAIVYSGLPTGCVSANVVPLPCTPTANGTFVVRVNVTDANGFQVSGTATDTVDTAPATPAPLSVTGFVASPGTVAVGNATYLNATVLGGTPPLTYNFTGLPAGCASVDALSLECRPTVSGTFNITFHATDAGGRTSAKSTTLTVTGPGRPTTVPPVVGTGPAPARNDGRWILVGGAILTAIVVAVLVGLWLRRRRGSPPAPSDEYPPSDLAAEPESSAPVGPD